MLESSIISNLVHNRTYWDVALPHIKAEYFESETCKLLFKIILEHSNEYNNMATPDVLKIKSSQFNANETLWKLLQKELSEVSLYDSSKPIDNTFLMDETKEWMVRRAVFNVIFDSIDIYEDPKRSGELGQIPERMLDALSVEIDEDLGEIYWEQAGQHWDNTHSSEFKIPFGGDCETLNKVTGGGAELKTLNAISAGINVGKTTCLISLAVGYMEQGYDVVYFSGEISEEKIRLRTDPRTTQKDFDFIKRLNKVEYTSKMSQIKASRSWGELFIKELPGGNTNEMRAYIKNIHRRRKIKPVVFMFDYITEFTSSRLPIAMMSKSDLYYGSVARELRALMFEFNGLGWTATQLQRSMQNSAEASLDNTADSITIPKVLDFQLGIFVPDEFIELKLAHCSVFKSRYGNKPNFQMKLCQETQTLCDPDNGINIMKSAQEGKDAISAATGNHPKNMSDEKAPKQSLTTMKKATPSMFNNDIKI